MKKLSILFLFSFFVLSLSAFVLAQERPLEIDYPEFFGVPPPGTVKTDIAQYFRYIYYAALAIGGLIALGALIYGGSRYLSSFGSPTALQDAKDQIMAALLGMLILFGSWVVLYAINPQLVALQTPLLRPSLTTLSAGVYLCKEDKKADFDTAWNGIASFKENEARLKTATTDEEKESIINILKELSKIIQGRLKNISEKCYVVGGSGSIEKDFTSPGNYATHIYFAPKEDDVWPVNYGAILYKEPGFKGEAKIVFDLSYINPVGGSLSEMTNPFSPTTPFEKPFSIRPFIVNYEPLAEWKVITYEEVDYNTGFSGKQEQTFPPAGTVVGLASPLSFHPKSLKITHPNSYITVLSKEATFSSQEVFIKSESDLLKDEYDEIIEWDYGFCLEFWRCKANPAANHIFLISANIY